MEDLTDLLLAHRDGDPAAMQELVPLVYEDLRRIARQQLARLRPGRTLDTTALVNEAYLRLVDESGVRTTELAHFFAIAATAMRQILVDHTRRRAAVKRGGKAHRISLESVQIGVEEQAELLLALDEALHKLSSLNTRLTRVFECRYFAGLGEQETAEALGVSLRTVQRDWMKSRAWLRRELASIAPVDP